MLNVNGQGNGIGIAGQKGQQKYGHRGERQLEYSENNEQLNFLEQRRGRKKRWRMG